MKSIASIQLLRFLAAWMVVLHHFIQYFVPRENAWTLTFAERGILGVDVFFVISGFIMFHVVAEKDRFHWLEFAAARFFRIVPAYWLFTLVLILAKAMAPSGFTNTDWTFESLLSSLMFIPSVNLASSTPLPPLIVGWSLNLEVLFYLLLCCSLIFGRMIGFAATGIFCCIISLAVPVPYGLMGEFVLGILLGLACRAAPGALAQIQRNPWIGFSTLSVAAWMLMLGPLQLRPIGAGLLVLSGLLLEPLAKRIHPKVLYLGDISYSTYLLHLIVLGIAFALFGQARSFAEGLGVLALTSAAIVGLSHLSFRHVERNALLQVAHKQGLRKLNARLIAQAP